MNRIIIFAVSIYVVNCKLSEGTQTIKNNDNSTYNSLNKINNNNILKLRAFKQQLEEYKQMPFFKYQKIAKFYYQLNIVKDLQEKNLQSCFPGEKYLDKEIFGLKNIYECLVQQLKNGIDDDYLKALYSNNEKGEQSFKFIKLILLRNAIRNIDKQLILTEQRNPAPEGMEKCFAISLRGTDDGTLEFGNVPGMSKEDFQADAYRFVTKGLCTATVTPFGRGKLQFRVESK